MVCVCGSSEQKFFFSTSVPGEIFVMGVLWVKIVWLYTSETLASFADQVSCSSGLGWAIWNSTGGLGHFWVKLRT